MADSDLSAERAREIFRYDPETGILIRRACPATSWQDRPVGSKNDHRGYLKANVGRRPYFVHRLIWLIVYGEWPDTIDHINYDPSDNRIANLRSVTRQVNLQYRRDRIGKEPKPEKRKLRDHRSPGMGSVFLNPAARTKPYRARLVIDGKNLNLGYYATTEEAYAALEVARRERGML